MDLLANLVAKAFANQQALNDKLRPDWVDQGWRYYRAIWTEMAEAIMHTNWAWWKTKVVDAPLTDKQAVELYIEFCDVLHFGLSLDLIRYGEMSATRVKAYIDAFEDAKSSTKPCDECIEAVVIDAIMLRDFNIKKFAMACKAAGLSLPGLLSFYFAKSVLNDFRWKNGYKEKTYTKMWKLDDGPAVEDNTVLGAIVSGFLRRTEEADVLTALDTGEFTNGLYDKLEGVYATLPERQTATA